MQEKEEVILNFMKDKDYIPMKAKEIAMVLNIPKNRHEELIKVLNKLEQDMKIVKNRKRLASHVNIAIIEGRQR